MPRVFCELPNASLEISGVKFERLEDGRLISEEVEAQTAEVFASIAGYALVEEGDEPEPELTPAEKKAAQKKLDKEAADKLKADKLAEKELADKVEAERVAQELADKEAADKLAADEAAAAKAAAESGDDSTDKPEGVF